MMAIIIGLMNHIHPAIREMIILLILATVIGIAAQSVLPNGIPLKTEMITLGDDANAVAIPSVSINPQGDAETASNVSLADAFTAFQNETTLFLDARSAEEYQAGHIANAINLPVSAFMDSLTFLENLDPSQAIITYCDGEDCNASIDLAADLKMMGFTQVYFFFGGWLEWTEANYPIVRAP